MPEYVSILHLTGVAVISLAMAVWFVGLTRLLRGPRFGAATRHRPGTLGALPRQRRSGPALESVELTPAERDAFAGLVRQFGDSRA